MGLGLGGRRDDARDLLLGFRDMVQLPAFQTWTAYLLAWLERRPGDMQLRFSALSPLRIQDDPEAIFLQGWMACDVGEFEAGLVHIQRAVAKGYSPAPTLAHSPQFDVLRSNPAFRSAVAAAEAGRRRALDIFRDAGGERLLGLPTARGAA
jgi:hypothetical protein